MPPFVSFTTPVNSLGLPLALVPRKVPTGLENIKGLAPEDVCRLYWRLSSVSVYFKLRLGLETIEHAFSSTTPLAPIDRIATYPVLLSEGRDTLGVDYQFKLALHDVTCLKEGVYGATLFFEYTNRKTLHLSLHPLTIAVCQQRKLKLKQTFVIPFENHPPLTGYLYLYDGKRALSGEIGDIRIEMAHY